MSEREHLGWQQYGEASLLLAAQISASGYKPDIILGIARGGLAPAGSLGYALSVKNIYIMNVEYYAGANERLDVPIMLPPYLQLADLEDRKLLIVDDIADTGDTLAMIRDFCAEKVAEVRTAVLYEKDASSVKCDYVWRRTNAWVEFPWDELSCASYAAAMGISI